MTLSGLLFHEDSNARATPSRVASRNGAATNCTDSGEPSTLSPDGTVIAGYPLKLNGAKYCA